MGIGYVPEERRVFASLNVEENLEIAKGIGGPKPWSLERIMGLFPPLATRKKSMGNQLSGGEQQMLAIARILRQGARLLLLDEPTEGLAPLVVNVINSVIKELKQHDLTVLLVEQNLPFTMEVADRHYVISKGQIVYEGTSDDLKNNLELQKKYLAV
jgi:branched-chain amino acid transport system ATP-binding protein